MIFSVLGDKQNQGFTLIELMVTMVVMATLLGSVIAGYNTFNDNQRVKQAATTFKTNLRLAQTKAFSGQKPQAPDICTQLMGYDVSFPSSTTYTIQAKCTDGLVGNTISVTLPTTVTFNPLPSTITFRVLDQGVTSPATVSLKGISKTYGILISANGDITDLGFQ